MAAPGRRKAAELIRSVRPPVQWLKSGALLLRDTVELAANGKAAADPSRASESTAGTQEFFPNSAFSAALSEWMSDHEHPVH